MPIWEFSCVDGHVTEVIDVTSHTRIPTIPCSVCGKPAERIAFSRTHWQNGHTGTPLDRPTESHVSRAIGRVRQAERAKKL